LIFIEFHFSGKTVEFPVQEVKSFSDIMTQRKPAHVTVCGRLGLTLFMLGLFMNRLTQKP